MDAASPPSPFSFRQFRAIWVANLVSNMGFLIQSVGAGWLMTTITHSPRMVALVQSSVSLPIMFLALMAGAVADNFDRRKVMIASQCFMLTVSVMLSVLTAFDLLTPYILLTLTFLIGCGMAMNAPAWQASVGDLVPKASLPSAVAYNSVAFNIARSVGPAIGGAIVAAAGAAFAFLVNCFTYLGLIFVLLRWRPAHHGNTLPPERIGNAMAGGLRYVAMSPHLLRVMIRAVIFAGASSAIPSLMPLVARDLLQGNSAIYGILLGAFGLGAVIGALSGPKLRTRAPTNRIIGAASIGVALAAVALSMSTSMLTALPALIVAGMGWMLCMSTFNVSVQLTAPRWVVARAISIYQMTAFGSMGLSSWLFGSAAAAYGIPDALLIAAGALVAGVIFGIFVPMPDVETLNLDPLQLWTEPDTAVPVSPRNGPIEIAIRYRIDPADIPQFLNLMSERRRVRRRDGARRWTLYRDLADPMLWIERYHVSTWLDYVRHNQRRTHADAENNERIWELHRESGGPDVQRRIEVEPRAYSPAADDDGIDITRPVDDHH